MQTRTRCFLTILDLFLLLNGTSAENISAYFKRSGTYVDNCSVSVHRTLTSESEYYCAVSCSQDAECRRFLFCSSTSSCQLFVDNGDCRVSERIIGCSCYVKKQGWISGNSTCELGHYGDNCENVIQDCSEAADFGIDYNYRVVLHVKPSTVSEPFNVMCYPLGGGWAQLQRRNSECQFTNFNRSLSEYETGFGNYVHNSWLGFDKIIPLLSMPDADFSFNVYIVKTDGSYCQSHYHGIELNSTGSLYSLQLGQYIAGSPPCGDSLTGTLSLNGKPFSTADRDLTGSNNCATRFGGGWWFQSDVDGAECSRSFLTGTMNCSTKDNFWKDDLGTTQIKFTVIRLLRRRST